MTTGPDVSPLPDGVSSPADLAGTWSILQVIPRREKSLARTLHEGGVGYYLPLNHVRRREPVTGKWRENSLPLFPGYMFLRCEPVHVYDVLAVCRRHTYGVPIRVPDQGGLTRELSNIARALSAGPVEQWPELVAGRYVRICHGALRGMEGYIEQRDRRHLLVIRVTALGQSISVEGVNPEDVEAA